MVIAQKEYVLYRFLLVRTVPSHYAGFVKIIMSIFHGSTFDIFVGGSVPFYHFILSAILYGILMVNTLKAMYQPYPFLS